MSSPFRSLRAPRRGDTRSRLDLELLESREVPATITVTNLNDTTNTGDGVSLREALNTINTGMAANADVVPVGTLGVNDTILITPAGTIPITAQFEITRPVTVTGPLAGVTLANTTATAAATTRVMNINVLLGTAPFQFPGNVSLSNLRFQNGRTTESGGGINALNGNLTLTDVRVTNNTAATTGGGIHMGNGTLTMTGTTTTSSSVSNNVSTGTGGGINMVKDDLDLTNTTVSDNRAAADGGGIYMGNAVVTFFPVFGDLTLDTCTVSNNQATGPLAQGGGVHLSESSFVQVDTSTISGNRAGSHGGGIYFYSGGSLDMQDSTVSGNRSGGGAVFGRGGGIYLFGTNADLRNTTISGNTANAGGGVNARYGSSLYLGNCTVVFNDAEPAFMSAGGITAEGSSVEISSSIIAGNTGGLGTDHQDVNFDDFVLAENAFRVRATDSLIGILPADHFINGGSFSRNLFGTATAPLDPLLNFLTNNGGLTQTHALAFNSPALNGGSNFAFPLDQRGQSAFGPRDMGAYELQPFFGAPVFVTANAGTFVVGTNSLTRIISSGNTLPDTTLTGGTLPTGITYTNNGDSTGFLSGNAALDTGGIYVLTFTATNFFTTTQTFTLTVNEAPRIVSLNNVTFLVNQFNSFVVTTAGFPDPDLFVNSTLPTGVTFVDNGDGTATISGTPVTAGDYAVSLTAQNGIGQDALQSLTLRVAAAPIITTPNVATFTEGTLGTFTVASVGSPLPALTVTSPLPPGVTFVNNGDGTGTLSGTPTAAGTYSFVFTASNGISPDATQSFTLTVLPAPPISPPPTSPPPVMSPPPVVSPPPVPTVPPPPVPGTPGAFPKDNILAVTPGSSAAGTELRVIDPTSELPLFTIVPFVGYTGAMHTASGDVNGDGVADYAVGAGIGGGPHVIVYDGRTMAELVSFFAFDPSFTGGVSLAIGDVTGDGVGDLIVAAGPGGGPHVKVFAGPNMREVRSFFAYDASFAGGVNVAAGDLNGDGRDEILTAAKSGGGPHVKAFDSLSLAVVHSFFAYDTAFTGGVSVTAGDLNGDGRDEIITAAGAGGGPHVKVFSGQTGAELSGFFAYDTAFTGGVNVAAGDLNGDGRDDILTGVGLGGGPHLKAFDGPSLLEVKSFFPTSPLFRNGVLVS